MSDERIMSAAEADRDACVQALDLHQAKCEKFQRGRHCNECHGLGRHVERTQRQIELLTTPGETQELF